ncbi:F0F1 ATP synthase subunit gamma [Pseudodonghicola xiamenensis]|uniref:ATP synthase gamma chain n=1 Tax=Pseudodonghicola xiamenensis TaxID=337702 RepID=A0A8J3MF98_9RHOB|nr:FoF1 ATP synthase subunit gamma [Pseudodonghicola xiamenensis]GHH03206.1 ATP synthase gamma chain [Pseudodonghicola xiamenensis]
MEELSRIQARLDSLGDLDELVGALRSMAASRSREATEAFAGTRAYCDIVERAIDEIAPLVRDPGDFGTGEERVLLVITSENGFVGGFNARLIECMVTERRQDETLIIVGRRGRVTAMEHAATADFGFSMCTHVAGVTGLARRIAARLSNVAAARILYAQHRTGASFDVDVEDVLPLSRPDGPAAAPPLFQLPPPDLMRSLAGEYLFAKIAHALMESLASENSARLTAMDAASRNIGHKLETLHRDERAARQEKTTNDMIEVVTGAQAVGGTF